LLHESHVRTPIAGSSNRGAVRPAARVGDRTHGPAAAGLYLGLPRLAGLNEAWRRLLSGDPLLLGAAALLECASDGAYVYTFDRLLSGSRTRIGWKESYDISRAGAAASRVFAAAGAGRIAPAWALDRSGMDRKLLW
jgi:hypothetical protein